MTFQPSDASLPYAQIQYFCEEMATRKKPGKSTLFLSWLNYTIHPNHHHPAPQFLIIPAAPHQQHKPVRKADTARQNKLDHDSEDIIGERHPGKEHCDQCSVGQPCNDGGGDDPLQLRVAGIAPDASVELEKSKDR